MLANPLFVCLTCIHPGAYFYILGGQGSLRVTKRVNKFCFGAIYNGRLWEKELHVSAHPITLMLFDSCLSLKETVSYSKGQPTPYSNSSKNVAFAILYAKDTAFDNIWNIVLPQNQLSDP